MQLRKRKPGAAETHNRHYFNPTSVSKSRQVAEGLRQILLELYEAHLSPDGKGVRYSHLAADPLFRLFVTATAELRGVEVGPLGPEERKAFFLNTYNVIIVHALAVVGPASNFLER